jgi:3-hydroxybutyryl-CoA dehydratase
MEVEELGVPAASLLQPIIALAAVPLPCNNPRRSKGGSMFPGKHYSEVQVGDTFRSSLTITETHLVLAAGLFGDFNPLHVDDIHARASRFGGRILHGPFTSALMSASVGMYFHTAAIAYLEHSCRFIAPVRPGDTLTTEWTIVEKVDKPKHAGGIVVLTGTCRNQTATTVAEAEGKILVAQG